MLHAKDVLPLSTVRRELPQLLKTLGNAEREEILITKDGKSVGVLMSSEAYDTLMETLAILSDASLLERIRQGEADARAGRLYTHDEVFGA